MSHTDAERLDDTTVPNDDEVVKPRRVLLSKRVIRSFEVRSGLRTGTSCNGTGSSSTPPSYQSAYCTRSR
jgi:hypothetical protein